MLVYLPGASQVGFHTFLPLTVVVVMRVDKPKSATYSCETKRNETHHYFYFQIFCVVKLALATVGASGEVETNCGI